MRQVSSLGTQVAHPRMITAGVLLQPTEPFADLAALLLLRALLRGTLCSYRGLLLPSTKAGQAPALP